MVKNARGFWGFPKGHIDDGETEEQAALREVNEETGLDELRLLSGFRHVIHYKLKGDDGSWTTKGVIFYLMECTGSCDRIELSEEHTGYEWLAFTEAYRRISYENARGALAAAYAQLLVPKGLARQ